MEAKGAIYEAIPAIMAEVGAIGKDRKNTQQGYNFRGIDDVYAALQGLLAKHKVFTVPEVLEDRMEERQSRSGGALIYRILKIRYQVCASDGSSVTAVVLGEGMDSGDKGSNKAMSVAHKYLFLQLFAIPTDDPKDPENESHDIEPKHTAKGGQAEATVARVFADRMKVCPTCGEPKVMPSKYGKGWYCLACKGKFAEDHPGVMNAATPAPSDDDAPTSDKGLF